ESATVGPVSCGPDTTGPDTTGPAATGPAATGPAATGAAMVAAAGSTPPAEVSARRAARANAPALPYRSSGCLAMPQAITATRAAGTRGLAAPAAGGGVERCAA